VPDLSRKPHSRRGSCRGPARGVGRKVENNNFCAENHGSLESVTEPRIVPKSVPWANNNWGIEQSTERE